GSRRAPEKSLRIESVAGQRFADRALRQVPENGAILRRAVGRKTLPVTCLRIASDIGTQALTALARPNRDCVRKRAGGTPNSRLKARLNAASDSYPTSPAICDTE